MKLILGAGSQYIAVRTHYPCDWSLTWRKQLMLPFSLGFTNQYITKSGMAYDKHYLVRLKRGPVV
jgi:hypothetical protein